MKKTRQIASISWISDDWVTESAAEPVLKIELRLHLLHGSGEDALQSARNTVIETLSNTRGALAMDLLCDLFATAIERTSTGPRTLEIRLTRGPTSYEAQYESWAGTDYEDLRAARIVSVQKTENSIEVEYHVSQNEDSAIHIQSAILENRGMRIDNEGNYRRV